MEARDAAKCLTMHRTALHKKALPSPKCLTEPQLRNPALTGQPELGVLLKMKTERNDTGDNQHFLLQSHTLRAA